MPESPHITLGDIVISIPSLGFLIFGGLATVAIISSLMMITRKDAVHSALWLVVTFFQLAGLYVMLGAEFLAVLQVLVYTGAILVLFLFVIMLLNLRENAPKLGGVHTAQLLAAWPIGLILAAEIITVLIFSNLHLASAGMGDKYGTGPVQIWSATSVQQAGGNVAALGTTLYTQFLLPFEIASLILLVAVLGAIVLARKEEPAEVEEVVPNVGISLGRRSVSDSPQEEQLEKKLLPALGRPAPEGSVEDIEIPLVEQPTAVGEGTTSGVEAGPGKR